MTLGPDGLVYVGIFPSGNLDGIVYRIDPPARPTRLIGLAEMRRDVPETSYAGVHGVAFGNDGTLYFVNQNTSGSTNEPLGQVLARRPSGKIELIARGLNFDWPRGFDGDIVVSQATTASTSAPVDMTGRAQGTLDAPTTPGTYGIRVLVTDPRSGAISEARGSVQISLTRPLTRHRRGTGAHEALSVLSPSADWKSLRCGHPEVCPCQDSRVFCSSSVRWPLRSSCRARARSPRRRWTSRCNPTPSPSPARAPPAPSTSPRWNIEWFGDTGNGPSNETLQLNNARDVISGTDFDIWGVAEIVSNDPVEQPESQLPGYAGFLANESNVINGPAYYSDFSSTEQKVGILYKSALATVQDARVILTANDSDFAGRPPLQVTLRVTLNGTTEDIVVIVLHAKCCSDSDSWQRRQNASNALKSYLDAQLPDAEGVGDRRLQRRRGHLDHPAARLALRELRQRQPPTTSSPPRRSRTPASPRPSDFPDTIDHHLNTNDSNAQYVAGSAEVYRVDQFISNYGSTTSDHFPVLSRYTWGGGGGGSARQVILNEILANEPGSNTAGEAIEIVNVGSGGRQHRRLDAVRRHPGAPHLRRRHHLAAGQGHRGVRQRLGHPAGLTNAVAASTGSLSLTNSGDTVCAQGRRGGGQGQLHLHLVAGGHRRRVDEPQPRRQRRRPASSCTPRSRRCSGPPARAPAAAPGSPDLKGCGFGNVAKTTPLSYSAGSRTSSRTRFNSVAMQSPSGVSASLPPVRMLTPRGASSRSPSSPTRLIRFSSVPATAKRCWHRSTAPDFRKRVTASLTRSKASAGAPGPKVEQASRRAAPTEAATLRLRSRRRPRRRVRRPA